MEEKINKNNCHFSEEIPQGNPSKLQVLEGPARLIAKLTATYHSQLMWYKSGKVPPRECPTTPQSIAVDICITTKDK